MNLAEVTQLQGEDSLENTFNCVPKVQGGSAESLRQTDGDMHLHKITVPYCEQSFLGLLTFYFQKEGISYVR